MTCWVKNHTLNTLLECPCLCVNTGDYLWSQGVVGRQCPIGNVQNVADAKSLWYRVYTGFITTKCICPYSTLCLLELISMHQPNWFLELLPTARHSNRTNNLIFWTDCWRVTNNVCVVWILYICIHTNNFFSIFCFYGAFYIVFILYEKLGMVCCIPSSFNNFFRPNNKIFTCLVYVRLRLYL